MHSLGLQPSLYQAVYTKNQKVNPNLVKTTTLRSTLSHQLSSNISCMTSQYWSETNTHLEPFDRNKKYIGILMGLSFIWGYLYFILIMIKEVCCEVSSALHWTSKWWQKLTIWFIWGCTVLVPWLRVKVYFYIALFILC